MSRVILVLFWLAIGFAPALAQTDRPVDSRPGCDACLLKMDAGSVKDFVPTAFAGNWLFTRVDDYANADVDADTSKWELLKVPGPWPALTEDLAKELKENGKSPRIGWYRGVIEFQPDQVAKEYVLLLPARLSRVEVYIDGNEVYRRPANFAIERFFAHQPIPIIFKPKTKQMTLAIKLESVTGDGILEQPFEMRRYHSLDSTLTWHQFRGGELRLMIAWGGFAFSLFFFIVFARIRQPLYLIAALGSLTAAPYLAIPTDVMLRSFEPEPLAFLQSAGLICVYFFYLFCQYFDKPNPKLNWALGLLIGATVIPIVYWATLPYDDLDTKVDFALYFTLRRVLFFTNLFMVGLSIYHLIRAARAKHDGSFVLLASMLLFAVITVHDALMVIGVIQAVAWVPFDTMIFLAAMIYVASSTFASTFKANERLVGDLKGINDNLEHLVSTRTAELHEKTADIQAMLQNMRQGILMVQSGGTVHPEYSQFLEQILETRDIGGRDALALILANTSLGSDARDSMQTAVAACIGEDSMNFEFNSHLLLTDLDKTMPDGRIKSLNLGWSPICGDGDVVEKLMVVIRDVTELRRLAAEAEHGKRELEMIGQILRVRQEKFHEFVDSSRAFVAENQRLLSAATAKSDNLVGQLFRNMHTIKGNARTFGFLHLTNIVHETEQAYDLLRKDSEAVFDQAALLGQLQSVDDALEEYATINDVTLGRKGPGRRASVERYVMVPKEHIDGMVARLDAVDREVANTASVVAALDRLHLDLRVIGTETLASLLEGVLASLPSLAKELGKETPSVVIEDHGIVVRNQIADLLRNVFMHLYRNSMDHGIEGGEQRQKSGKAVSGIIRLVAELDGQHLVLRLSDDGRGLALAAIRRRGVERGLIDAATATDDNVAQLIFAAGFSTAEAVTEVSGRGVGMDAVKDFVARENGAIELRFTDTANGQDFRSFETVITLPAHFGLATG